MADASFFCGGDVPVHQIYSYLEQQIPASKAIDLAVSFIRLSGVRLLLPILKKADLLGIPIRIVCGSYMQITEPAALLVLRKELSEKVQLHLYEEPHRSFHPKCWIFYERETRKEDCHILIGSSNLSRSALTAGIEWNYAFRSDQDAVSTRNIVRQFDHLWKASRLLDAAAIEEYRKTWTKPALPLKKEDDTDPLLLEDKDAVPVPNAIQTEALYALEESRKEGSTRALIQAATGTGKTWLAAFDSRTAKKILFVAHRREILEQAEKTFRRLRPDLSAGYVMAGRKELDRDLVLASVATLGQPELLQTDIVSPRAFEYLIVDEFHHAAADSYRRILEYFQPQFLLGLTATPYRLDGRDLYALCDYNVPYRVDLFEAIRLGLLSPFHYYGIYDETDYSSIRFVRGHYDTKDLSQLYVDNLSRAENILRHFRKYHSNAALGFCVSKEHARFMASFFQEHGIRAASVVSGTDPLRHPTDLDRQEALRKLREGALQILFTVDLFNEGVDIPFLDMVLFLRPTESAVIYLQQLGRGLRLAEDKPWLTVLDFIGNYRSASLGPSLLLHSHLDETLSHGLTPGVLPAGCLADFDLQLIDLFQDPDSLVNRARNLKQSPAALLHSWLVSCMDSLGHVPTRMEFASFLEEEQLQYVYKHARINPFRDYLSFLQQEGLLSPALQKLHSSAAGKFLQLLETTSMSKVYKLPLLLSMIRQREDGSFHLQKDLDAPTALEGWLSFFTCAGHWQDLGCESAREVLAISESGHLQNIRKNPAKFLVQSGRGFFEKKDGFVLSLSDDLLPFLDDPLFIAQMQDILRQRTDHYYQTRFARRLAD